MIWSGLLGFMLTAGLLSALPIAACVAWLSSRGRFHRFGRVLAFASAGVLSALVAYVASGMLRRASGLLLRGNIRRPARGHGHRRLRRIRTRRPALFRTASRFEGVVSDEGSL
jgi:hypothetical protein